MLLELDLGYMIMRVIGVGVEFSDYICLNLIILIFCGFWNLDEPNQTDP